MNWMEVAVKAKSMLPTQPSYGNKQKAMADAAMALGHTRQSLRNILAAYEFLLTLQADDTAAHEALSKTPYSAVEIYSRWATYDRKAALAHAVWGNQRGASVKSIIADEKDARARAQAKGVTTSGFRNLIDVPGVLARLRSDAVDLLSKAGAEDTSSGWRTLNSGNAFAQAMMIRTVFAPSKVDLSEAEPATLTGALCPAIGILELGERSLSENYRKDAKDFLAKAIAASTIYALVVLVAPNKEALEALTEALPNPFRQTITEGRSKIFSLKRCLGGIMFTSQEDIGRDLVD